MFFTEKSNRKLHIAVQHLIKGGILYEKKGIGWCYI